MDNLNFYDSYTAIIFSSFPSTFLSVHFLGKTFLLCQFLDSLSLSISLFLSFCLSYRGCAARPTPGMAAGGCVC